MNNYDDEVVAAQTGWGAPRPLSIPATTTDALLTSMEIRLCGWSLRETTGAALGTARLRGGGTVAGEIIAGISVPAGGSDSTWFGDLGFRCGAGLFLDMISGRLEGAVFVRFPM